MMTVFCWRVGRNQTGDEENLCSAPIHTLPKTRKMEAWRWEDDDSVEEMVKHPFSGQPGTKRCTELQAGASRPCALLGEHMWNMIALHTNAFACEKQILHPGLVRAVKSRLQSYWSMHHFLPL